MNIVIALCLLPLALVTVCFAVELFIGLQPLRAPGYPSRHSRGVIIVPAHDEAEILAPRLGSLKESIAPIVDQVSILLVADNCTDNTADIARASGVTVIDRFDGMRRGKGYALDFARKWLTKDPPDVIIIVDADCSIDTESVTNLLLASAETGAPCQAINLQRPQAGASAAVQVSTFAFYVKNVIRQRALARLARRVQLLGTGMAIPWTLFERANLATSSIVEDIKLGHELAAAGHAPLLVERATVWSDAETEANTLSQRRRWEGGFLNEAMRQGPSRLLESARHADLRGMWAALSIMVPPFALLVLADLTILLIASVALWVAGTGFSVLLLLAVPLLLAAIGLVLAWLVGGSRFVSIGALMTVPLYLAWKLPMYVAFVRRGVPKDWLRTDRS